MHPSLHEKSVLVVSGGTTEKREDSLRSGAAIFHSLRRELPVFEAHVTRRGSWEHKGQPTQMVDLLHSSDTVINALHGEDAVALSRLCQQHQTNYLGTTPAMAKTLSSPHARRRMLRRYGIQTLPHWQLSKHKREGNDVLYTAILDELDYPAVLSPLPGSVSGEFVVVESEKELLETLREVFSEVSPVYITPATAGRVFSVFVVEEFRDQDLYSFPAFELLHDHRAANARHLDDDRITDLKENSTSQLEEIARKSFAASNMRDLGVINILETSNKENYVLDIEPHPRLGRHSLLAESTRAVGTTIEEVLSALISKRQKNMGN